MTKLNKSEENLDDEVFGPLDITDPVKPKPVALGSSKSAAVNNEEMVLQEFKKALLKKAKMTPEEFYRTIDL